MPPWPTQGCSDPRAGEWTGRSGPGCYVGPFVQEAPRPAWDAFVDPTWPRVLSADPSSGSSWASLMLNRGKKGASQFGLTSRKVGRAGECSPFRFLGLGLLGVRVRPERLFVLFCSGRRSSPLPISSIWSQGASLARPAPWPRRGWSPFIGVWDFRFRYQSCGRNDERERSVAKVVKQGPGRRTWQNSRRIPLSFSPRSSSPRRGI